MSLIDKLINEGVTFVFCFIEALEILYHADLPSLVDLFIVLKQLLNDLFKDILRVYILF